MKHLNFLIAFLLISTGLLAQKQDILLSIGDKKITDEEFKYIYSKNNTKELGRKNPEDYLDLFINFKLFVADAERLKMDTSEQFINELQGYKDQLAHPFLAESKVYDELLQEAYENSKTDAKFDLIFIKIDKRSTKEQEQKAKQKADKIRSRILKGEDFYKVAQETSDQRSVARNHGEYPFMPLSGLPYSLQNYLKTAEKGTVSHPIPTQQGYFIARLNAKRPNPGRVQVAHIMLATPEGISEEDMQKKETKADSILKRLNAGDSFEELAKTESDDKNSAGRGGAMSPFTSGRMVEPFEEAAFALEKVGDYSKVVKTQFGLHILTLLDKLPPEDFDQVSAQLKRQIDADPERREIIVEKVNSKLKTQFNFQSFKGNDQALFKMLDSTIYQAKWTYDEETDLSGLLFKAGSKNYYLKDFAEYLLNNQRRQQPVDLQEYYNDQFDRFVYQMLTELEKDKLENTNERYANIIREYRDGMLLFEYKKKFIWDKAAEDSTKLKDYFKNNKKRFQNNLELEMSVFEYQNEKAADKFLSMDADELIEMSDDDILAKLERKDKDFQKTLSGTFSRGDDQIVDEIINIRQSDRKSKSIMHLSDKNYLVLIRKEKQGPKKEFHEIKGLVISDYQNYLEKEKLEELKKRFEVKVNKDVLQKIKREL